MLKDDEITLAVIRNIASLSSNSATGIVIVGGLVSGIPEYLYRNGLTSLLKSGLSQLVVCKLVTTR